MARTTGRSTARATSQYPSWATAARVPRLELRGLFEQFLLEPR